MTTWGTPTVLGKITLVDKLNQNGKRPGHRLGQRAAEASGNPVVLTDWHVREQKYESKTIRLELQLCDAQLKVAAEADRCNQEYAIANKGELFSEGTDALDVKGYYKSLCADDNVLRLKLHKSETKIFHMEGAADARRVAKNELHKNSPVCVEVTDQGLWFNGEDGSWGPRWVARNVYITGSPTGPLQVEDDEFEDT